ncbi:hypothetical protein [Neobacillus bataviensis]|uniref:hypothetical protein n=1 Tax=Neobacillus bataviensis TaxID=220685 RepID=UPI001CBB8A21|nr:hypothetical protein [Neobacillus bataviensis]
MRKIAKKIVSLVMVFIMLMSLPSVMTPVKGVQAAGETQQNSQDPNLKLWYKFDETSGTTVTDSSGNDFNGAYVNTPEGAKV